MERAWTSPRPALDRLLDGALTHRLTTVVAAAGYGKSTLLAGWVEAVGGAIHRIRPSDRDLTRFAGGVVSALRLRAPDLPAELAAAVDAPLGPEAHTDELARAGALAGAVAETLAQRLRRDLVLVLDDIDPIAEAAGAVRFLEVLVRTAPRRLHLVTASRDPLPFPVARLHQDHEVLELDATDLALDPAETAAWLRERLGERAVGLAPALHAACSGWPAAVHAAIDGLARTDPADRPDRAARLVTSTTLDGLIREAYEELPAVTRRLLQAGTVLPVLTDRLAAALGAQPDTLAALTARGLFLDADPDGHRLTPTARHVLRQHAPLDRHEAHDVAAVAARWYSDHGEPQLALRAAVDADHPALIGQLLAEAGEQLVEQPDGRAGSGGSTDLLTALDRLPEAERVAPELVRLAGIAHQNRGDWQRARELLGRVAEGPAFDAAVAARLGLIDHLRGELEPALAAYRRGSAHGRPPADAAVCTAMAAAVLWLRGDRDGCAELADRSLEQAAGLGDARALAAAHTVLAMLAALDGDARANDAHYLRALEYAERAGDVVQQIRIRSNRSSHRHGEGAYLEALTELEIAGRLSDLTGFAPFAALALSNRAQTLIRLGRLEEAAVDAADAAARWEALGSRLVGYGLTRLAQIQALRGNRIAAADGYRRAIVLAEQAGDAQGLGLALCELAELLADDTPEEAARLADRALRHRDGMAAVTAPLAAARVALGGGRPEQARSLLDEAEAAARDRRDRPGLAAAIELRAALEADPDLADQAVRRWTEVGDPIGRARAELVRARLGDPGRREHVAADVRARMREIGCRALDPEIDALLASVTPPPESRLLIETLGAFRVVRGAAPIPRTAWQSRKARDLLKILVTRLGRPVAREQLVETMWPDEPDEQVGLRRLNVMVSTLRGVLDPDHRYPADHVVVSDAGSLRLDPEHVAVDVSGFLAMVSDATRLDQAGRSAAALARWRAAEAAYTGDFCEEDPYADWAVALREQARLGYVQAAGRLAAAEAEAGRYEPSARYWLRLLERDRYDERAHLNLVRVLDLAGRRGDARRRYQVYTELMRELDLEPSPHPPET